MRSAEEWLRELAGCVGERGGIGVESASAIIEQIQRDAVEACADMLLFASMNQKHPPLGPEDYTRGWADACAHFAPKVRALAPGGSR